MAYTTIDKPTDYFETLLYTGTGSSNTITGLDFTPNWVWIKPRNDSRGHSLIDSVRGVSKWLGSNDYSAELTVAQGVTSFNSNGFTVGTSNDFNKASNTHVAWNWKAGTSFTNDASSTGIGTIDSTGSANDNAGFSIVSYVGTGSAGTIKHGLNSAPTVIFAKDRESTQNWQVYHSGLGAANRYLELNTTAAYADGYAHFAGTAPTSSVFSIGAVAAINANGNNTLCYCFAEKKGYSKFGSYTGNGNADGPFVYTGFKPAWLLIKQTTDSGQQWEIFDNKRDGYNDANRRLFADANSAEPSASNRVRICSNGFKLVTSGGTHVNGNGKTHIYMAFAESPFVNSNGVPTTAR